MTAPKIINRSVDVSAQGTRLDKYLFQNFPKYSRTYWQKLIEQKTVLVNGEPVKPSHKLSMGELIQAIIPEALKTEIIPQNIHLKIVYEDSDIIVINKPAGLIVHPGAGIRSGTLVNALLYHCKDLSGVGGRLRPGIVHRLDKNTSGLIVAAKNDNAHLKLTGQLQIKSMLRKYCALVWFSISEKEGKIDTFLSRSKRNRKIFVVSETGKKAITHFKVLKNYRFLSLLELQLETGRTHQIRSHLNFIHHPVFGDPEYNGRLKQLNQLHSGKDKLLAKELLGIINRQSLHAIQLRFNHPKTDDSLTFNSDLPDDMQTIIEYLEKSSP
jgi:23S rRNA pseudouridine1911/1915/1917 synthase